MINYVSEVSFSVYFIDGSKKTYKNIPSTLYGRHNNARKIAEGYLQLRNVSAVELFEYKKLETLKIK